MIDPRPVVFKSISALFLFISFLFGSSLKAQDGKALFQLNCASCHSIHKDGTGPALANVESRWPNKDLLKLWIRNWNKAVATGDPYSQQMAASRPAVMNPFDHLGDKEIESILEYISKVPPPPPPGGTPGSGTGDGNSSTTYSESDNAILYGVLTLILAVIAFIMLQVNSNLKKLVDDKEHIPSHEPIPFYRNKSYIVLLTLILFVVGGFYAVKGAIGLGREKDYQPEQPIYYSHKVHVGQNQISCLYCHSSALESKHATIPSVNICMNCHMNITEYTGEQLYREDGSEVSGTAEIKKLHEYAGFTPGQTAETWDPSKGKPIPWIQIHNLPDHVYFNHSQHTKAGKVQCQTCHGEIQNMGEVKQFSELSMGWCINCHRESKVDFGGGSNNEGNKFYSIYEKYHNEIKAGKRDSVTVNEMGGLECQKCHY